MIPKKYKKYITWIILFLATIWIIGATQQEALIKVIDSFTEETSTWVTQE